MNTLLIVAVEKGEMMLVEMLVGSLNTKSSMYRLVKLVDGSMER